MIDIVWQVEKVVDENDIITHIKYIVSTPYVIRGRVVREGEIEVDAPDPDLVAQYRESPVEYLMRHRGISRAEAQAFATENRLEWDELPDPDGFMRPEWIQRDTLERWLFSKIDRAAIEAEIRSEVDAANRPVEPVASPPPSQAVVALEGMEALKAKIDGVRAGTDEMTPDELLQMYRDDPPGAAEKLEDAVRALKGEARRKLSELLNVELAELKNLRGMAGEDRVREQQIEYLLGLFTRLGEI